jgi:hypothetical protein
MTKLKKLKETAPEWMTMSLFDCLEMLDPSKTNKFVPMMMNIVNSEFEKRIQSWGEHELHELKDSMLRNYPTLNVDMTPGKISDTTLHMMYTMFDKINNHERDLLTSFMTYYEKNQFSNVDINQIKDINEVEKLVTQTEIKNIGKEFAKQIHVDLENDTWCVLRPLTHESSVKYGSSTRWCTASKNNPYQFFNYTENGMLIYCINKSTGYKLAIHAYKNHYGGSGEISFWNSKDDRIDSLMTELDFETFQLIKNIVTSKNILSNKELGENYWLESFNKNNMEKDASPTNEAVQHIPIPTRVVETNLNERRYIEYEDAIEEIRSYEMTLEQ